MVKINHHHRSGRGVAFEHRGMRGELAVERAAVQQACQRVVVGEMLQLSFLALAVGDVLRVTEEAERHSVGGAQQRRVHGDMDGVARGVDVALLHAVDALRTVEDREHHLAVALDVLGMGDRREARSQQLLARVPDDSRERVIDRGEAQLEVEHHHPDGGLLKRVTEAILRLAQRVCGLLALCDVGCDQRGANNATVAIVDRPCRQRHVDVAPVVGQIVVSRSSTLPPAAMLARMPSSSAS